LRFSSWRPCSRRRLSPACHKGVYALVIKLGISEHNKKEKELRPSSTVLSLTLRSPKRTIDFSMVRLFTALCKSLLEILSDKIIFDDATSGYNYRVEACPRCGAIGKFKSYGKYSRGLCYHTGGKTVDSRVWVLRFECTSCGSTHALLPDVLTPYSPYSLSFVLTVLIAYFEREATVVDICAKFGIAVSTLYSWKGRIASHKELMIGILKSRATPALEFLCNLFESRKMSDSLRGFFRQYGFSFMQGQSAAATRSRPP